MKFPIVKQADGTKVQPELLPELYPVKVLLVPVVNKAPADLPKKVLKPPVVSEFPAFVPTRTLEEPPIVVEDEGVALVKLIVWAFAPKIPANKKPAAINFLIIFNF